MAVQSVPGGELLHIMAYAAEARGLCVSMEDAVTVCDLVIEYKLPENAKLAQVVLAPAGKNLEFEVKDNKAVIKLDRMDGYALLKMKFSVK